MVRASGFCYYHSWTFPSSFSNCIPKDAAISPIGLGQVSAWKGKYVDIPHEWTAFRGNKRHSARSVFATYVPSLLGDHNPVP
mmetsp:Transcript_39842/g.71360  ORF Transcript_39842/g.71360 Transcript_39842/m.71360 type:complete len:82 (+) Transcript_39842:259-504(+)